MQQNPWESHDQRISIDDSRKGTINIVEWEVIIMSTRLKLQKGLHINIPTQRSIKHIAGKELDTKETSKLEEHVEAFGYPNQNMKNLKNKMKNRKMRVEMKDVLISLLLLAQHPVKATSQLGRG
ncbi:hypothetical protein ACJX0J_025916 [Zea mays]